MNEFNKALTYVNELLYAPHHLTIKTSKRKLKMLITGLGCFSWIRNQFDLESQNNTYQGRTVCFLLGKGCS